MSVHTDRSYDVASGKRAAAAINWETWSTLMSLSKRELAEIAMHLGALCTDSYDDAIADGRALGRVIAERDALKANGML